MPNDQIFDCSNTFLFVRPYLPLNLIVSYEIQIQYKFDRNLSLVNLKNLFEIKNVNKFDLIFGCLFFYTHLYTTYSANKC